MAKYTEAEAVEFETVRTATERTREILESIDKQVTTIMMRMKKDFFSSQWPVFKFNSQHFLLFYVGRKWPVTYYDPVWSPIMTRAPGTSV